MNDNLPERSPTPFLQARNRTRELAERGADMVRQLTRFEARTAIVLGSGLGHFIDALPVHATIPFASLPGVPPSTAPGHAGRLICARVANVPTYVLQGRCHFYEGYDHEQVTGCVRLLKGLGVEFLLLSCAAGGLEPTLAVGDLLVIEDQIDLQFRRHGISQELGREQGGSPYHVAATERLKSLLTELKLPGRGGTYVAVSGPNYETRAEQRFLRMFATAVGMSMVAEAALARDLGMKVCGVATITNLCNPDLPEPTDGQHVVAAAARAEPRFRQLITAFFEELGRRPQL